MTMFGINQKVVFVDCDTLTRHDDINYPQLNEIVTITGIFDFDNYGRKDIVYFTLAEYPISKINTINGIRSECFRKLDYKFAEEILEEINKLYICPTEWAEIKS